MGGDILVENGYFGQKLANGPALFGFEIGFLGGNILQARTKTRFLLFPACLRINSQAKIKTKPDKSG